MKMKAGVLCLVAALLLGWSLITIAQDVPPTIRLLVVDETKTFTSTMKVAGTIGALRQMGLFDVSVKLTDVTTDFDDPLAEMTPAMGESPYDIVLILPRGLDTKADVNIWLVSEGFAIVSPFVRGAVELVSNVVDQVFSGSGQSIDVSEDLWPGFLAATYVLKGWIR